ncbi:hypothetical protein DB30_06645 [Enhygromyxa salina]|uniref:Uncharacterized protein n=1 Tax=Enhygromyxa salina TaxID=215803 RepID=A0A0C2CY59_9BACT|nr:hypothetical protein DB30_06645 [Enhygromyxa salina]
MCTDPRHCRHAPQLLRKCQDVRAPRSRPADWLSKRPNARHQGCSWLARGHLRGPGRLAGESRAEEIAPPRRRPSRCEIALAVAPEHRDVCAAAAPSTPASVG